jgi:hypothetical protein
MTVTDGNWRQWRGKRCHSGTSPTTNAILSEWGRDRIQVTDSNAQRPWGKPTQRHVTGCECCLAWSETAIASKHRKFKHRLLRPTSDPVLNYCQWDTHSCIRHIYRVIQEERSIFSSVRKKVHMNMCLVMYGCWDRAVWIDKYHIIVNGNKQKLMTVNFISLLIYLLNDKFVTVHNKCSNIPPSTSVHFATYVRRSRVVRLSWSSGLFMLAAASKMQARNWPGVTTFLM